MEIHCIYTASHEELAKQFLQTSIMEHGGMPLIMTKSRVASDGYYRSATWNRAIIEKCQLLIDMSNGVDNNPVVYLDADCFAYASLAPVVNRALHTADMALQVNDPYGNLCTGVMAMRRCQRVHNVWKEVYSIVTRNHGRLHDQDAFLLLMKRKTLGLRVSALPLIVYGGGCVSGQLWYPGMHLDIPYGIILHHANFVKGVLHKRDQLQYVRSLIAEGIHSSDASIARQIMRRQYESHTQNTIAIR